MENLAFDITLPKTKNVQYTVEVTENYEDDKWHVVIFAKYFGQPLSEVAVKSGVLPEDGPSEWIDTLGLDTPEEVFVVLRSLTTIGEIHHGYFCID